MVQERKIKNRGAGRYLAGISPARGGINRRVGDANGVIPGSQNNERVCRDAGPFSVGANRATADRDLAV
jgi:hypothetical protein